MGEPRKPRDQHGGERSGSSGWHRELIELAALFLAVALADLFANTLVHGPLGPVVLTSLGAALLLSAAARRWWAHRLVRAPSSLGATRPAAHSFDGSQGTALGRNLWRVRTVVRDTPGSLAALAASLAGHRFNILSVQVHAMTDGAVDEFLIETPAGATGRDIVAATESGGGRDVHADRADMHDLIDIPTRVLMLAAHSIGNGAQLPAALRMLLGASTVCPAQGTGEPSEEPDHLDGTAMRLHDPRGGVLTLQRAALEFTPAEFARARALRDLALRLRDRDEVSWPMSQE